MRLRPALAALALLTVAACGSTATTSTSAGGTAASPSSGTSSSATASSPSASSPSVSSPSASASASASGSGVFAARAAAVAAGWNGKTDTATASPADRELAAVSSVQRASAGAHTLVGMVGHPLCYKLLPGKVYETASVVVLGAELRNTAKTGQMCPKAIRAEQVTFLLSSPLGTRVVLDAATGAVLWRGSGS